MERALPESSRTAAQVDALLPEFMAYYDLHKADRTKPFDGLLPTMEKLQAAGALFAVAPLFSKHPFCSDSGASERASHQAGSGNCARHPC